MSLSNRSVLSERPSIAKGDDGMESLQKKYESAMKELEELRRFKQKVEESIEKGGYSIWDTRILHLRENPYSDLRAKKDESLKQQLETLRSKIQPSSPTSGTSPRAETSVMPLCESTYKEEIETLKKRIERMKEVFAAQTNRFRDAVYPMCDDSIVDIN